MSNTKADKGPTWGDAGTALEELRNVYRVGTTVALVPPLWVAATARSTNWVAVVSLHALRPPLKHLTSVQVSWGYSGAVLSAPAALLLAATKLVAWCEERQIEAEKQASF